MLHKTGTFHFALTDKVPPLPDYWKLYDLQFWLFAFWVWWYSCFNRLL